MAADDVFGIVGTTQAGNFHVERVVAEGGFGVVYRAQHGAFRAPVAIKCLKIPEQMTKQQRAVFLEKFREEAELMFRLSAAITEVVRPLHVDVLQLPDGRFVPFLALEWLEGESLDGIITRRREQGQAPLGLHKVVKMLRPVASALCRAHRFPGPQGAVSIIHRDLKPENIFVASIGGTESMKILDFGIAKAKRAASQAVGRITGRTLEEDESASFTPAYGAPEQWSPKTYGETGPWTDVWGLALTFVEALVGMPPLDGDTYVMRRACLDEKRRPTPRNLGADVPIEVDRVVERALSVDPRKRFKDIESFWSELEISIGLEPSLRTRDMRREPTEAAPAAPTPAAEKLGPGLTTTGARLAKIDLIKVPSVSSMPAVRLQGDLRPAPTLISDVPSTSVATKKADAKPAPSADPAPKPKPPAPPPKANPPAPPPKAKPAEDWSTLGLDGPPSNRPPPPVRRASIGLEMPLQSRPSSADLELSLPMHPEPPEPAPPAREAEAPRGMVRRNTSELELSLPIHPDGPPPPAISASASAPRSPGSLGSSPQPAPRAPQPDPRRSLSDLEMSLPTMEAAPASARSNDLEANLDAPERQAPVARPSRSSVTSSVTSHDDALDFDVQGASKRSPSVRPAPASGASNNMDIVSSPRPYGLVTRVDEKPPMGLRERLTAPLWIILVSLAIASVAFAFQKISGNPLELGPVRVTWIAGPVALVGVGLLLFRLIGVHEDE